MSTVVDVHDLTKTFGATRALDALELTVEAGEVHGFLGPNGAGKTTALRVLLGLVRADDGQVTVLGQDPWNDAASLHRRLAYVPGEVNLWPNLTGGEIIDLFGRLRGGHDPQRRDDLIARFGLDPTKKARAYSKGNRQKVALVAALASDVELLLLDEPTSGLDPLIDGVFRDCITAERERGRTVLIASHVLSEVEAICERVTMVREGRTVETGALQDMRHLGRTLIVAGLADPSMVNLQGLSGIHDVTVADNELRCHVDPDDLNGLLSHLSEVGLTSLVSRPPTLEELFLRHYRQPS